MCTTVWRPQRTLKPKASSTISSVLSDASLRRWKPPDRKAQSRRSFDFTMSKRERILFPSTRRSKTCFRLIESTTTRRSKWRILNWFIRFRSLPLRRNRKFSTTSSCGRSSDASYHSCRTKFDLRSRISRENFTAISTTTCHGTSARN